jgi:hypothetical protein
MRVADGAMPLRRSLAALLRVRPKPNFHRNDDRKLGEGMQGCARCELFRFFACGGRVSGAVEFQARLRSRRGREVKTRTLCQPRKECGTRKRLAFTSVVWKGWSPAMGYPGAGR